MKTPKLVKKLDDIHSSYDFLAKVVFIGEKGVGKTSLIQKFQKYEPQDIQPTIGLEFSTQLIKSSNNVIIKYQMWDCSGKDEYKNFFDNVIKGDTRVIFLVYSIDNLKSFEKIRDWYDDNLWDSESSSSSEMHDTNPFAIDIPDPENKQNDTPIFIIVGNKCDMKTTHCEVSKEEGIKFAKDIGGYFIETSAKLGRNVYSMFTLATIKLCEKYKIIPTRKHTTALSALKDPHCNICVLF